MREYAKMLNETGFIFPMLAKLGQPLWVPTYGPAGDGEFLLDVVNCEYYVAATRGFDTYLDPKMFVNERTKFRDSEECVRFVATVDCDDDEFEETGLECKDVFYCMEYGDIEKIYLKTVRAQKAYYLYFLRKASSKLYTDLINLIVSYTVAPEKIPRDIIQDVYGEDYPMYPEE